MHRQTTVIKTSELINPHFKALWNTKCPYVIAEGGRGSFKSSVISLWLVMALKRQTQEHHHANIVCIRENQAYLRDSVYEQILWAIDMLHLTSEYRTYKSPLKIEHIKTGSAFYFYGADDPQKLKSNKVSDIIGVWYEEAANVKSAEVFDQANPTFIRNKSPYVDDVKVFYSYNPPKNPYDWINEWIEKKRNDKQYFIDHSTYLDDELGFTTQQTLDLINSYKENDYDYYRYLYLGEAVGLGTSVYNMDLFKSVQNIGELPDDDHIVMLRFSADVGHSVSATTVGCYGITYKRRLVLLDTYYYSPEGKAHKLAPSELAPQIHDFIQDMQHKYPWPTDMLIMDSAEQALRNEYNRRYNVDWWNVRKLKKVDMIDRVQNVLAQGKLFYLPTETNLNYFIPEHQKYQWDEKTLQSEKPEVVKVDDHTCDQLQYLVRSSEDELGINW
ncbi:PBSX family phage terminase large subunit [Weissella minor]|nr:PBSX family phage terminase large subunit [Weissella minor]